MLINNYSNLCFKGRLRKALQIGDTVTRNKLGLNLDNRTNASLVANGLKPQDAGAGKNDVYRIVDLFKSPASAWASLVNLTTYQSCEKMVEGLKLAKNK